MLHNLLGLSLEEMQPTDQSLTVGYVPSTQQEINDLVARQDPLQILPNADVQSCETLDRESVQVDNTLPSHLDAVVALEAIANYIRNHANEKAFDKSAAIFANVAIEAIAVSANVRPERPAFALEAMVEDPQVQAQQALESIQATIDQLFTGIRSRIGEVTDYLVRVMEGFHRNLKKLRLRVAEVETSLQAAENKEAKFPAVKAEAWCEFLCYSETGFDQHLSNVGKDTVDFIQAHRDLCKTTEDKYLSWFKSNAKAGSDKVFDTLRYASKDFILDGGKEFTRTINTRTPAKDCHFVQSKELPGGQAYYLHAGKIDASGLDAVDLLRETDAFFAAFNPTSYDTMKAKLALAVGLPVSAWMTAVSPMLGIPLAAITGATLASSRIEGSGKGVHVDKEMIFQALTLEEIKKTLSEVNAGLNALEQWSIDVLQKPWRSSDLDSLIDEVVSASREHRYAAHMRTYGHAVINLMTVYSRGVHTYAFKVFNAMLSFAEKSVKQYS